MSRFNTWVTVSVISLLLALGFYLAHAPSSVMPAQLRIGILPDQDPKILMQRLQPLLGYLTDKTGLKTQLVMPQSYQALLDLFAHNQIEMAYFGGFTYVKAQSFYDAKPLVMREIDSRFVSCFISQGQQVKSNLEEFKGHSLRFGSRLSTSGHLMPRHFLNKNLAIKPEQFFSHVSYSQAHDQTIFAVSEGTVDLGVTNATILKEMLSSGRIKKEDIKVIWHSPPYSDYVWALQDTIPQELERTLRNVFLSLDQSKQRDEEVLTAMGAKRFLPAGNHNFETLKNVATSLNMLTR